MRCKRTKVYNEFAPKLSNPVLQSVIHQAKQLTKCSNFALPCLPRLPSQNSSNTALGRQCRSICCDDSVPTQDVGRPSFDPRRCQKIGKMLMPQMKNFMPRINQSIMVNGTMHMPCARLMAHCSLFMVHGMQSRSHSSLVGSWLAGWLTGDWQTGKMHRNGTRRSGSVVSRVSHTLDARRGRRFFEQGTF